MRLHRLLGLALLLLALSTHAADPPTPQHIRDATEAVYNDPDLHGLKADRELLAITGLTLDLDSTVMTRYGAQDGAARG